MSGNNPPQNPPPTPSCDDVRTAPLNSPQPAIVNCLSVNDRLFVVLDTAGGRPVLLVQDSNGNVAGSLTFLGHLTLIECIDQHGYSYEAVVLSISGGAVQLRIEPV